MTTLESCLTMGENINNTTELVKEIKGQQKVREFMKTIPCSVCDTEPVSRDGLCEKCHKELITEEKMHLGNNGLKSEEPIADIDSRLPEIDDLENDFEEDDEEESLWDDENDDEDFDEEEDDDFGY